MSLRKRGASSEQSSSADDSINGRRVGLALGYSRDKNLARSSNDRSKKRIRIERVTKRKSYREDESVDEQPKLDKYKNDPELMKHACIRPRKANCFELNIKNSPQFSGDKYVGRFSTLEQAQAAARQILQSENHLAMIARISAANAKYKKGSGDSSDANLDEPAPVTDYSGVESLMQADIDFCQEEENREMGPI